MALQILLLLILPVVIIAGILAVTIHEHITASALSLPIAPTLTSLVLALPLIAIANAVCLAIVRHRQTKRALAQQTNQRRITDGNVGGNGRSDQRLPSWTHVYWCAGTKVPSITALLQIIQAVFTVAIATLLIVNNLVGGRASSSSSSQQSPLLRCALETTWQRLWSQHDAAAMQRIQDALKCCGFNSVVDRAWPFPGGGGGGSVKTCAEAYGRTVACRVPWMQMARKRAGMELLVVALVAVFQSATLMRRKWWFAGGAGAGNLFDNSGRRRRPADHYHRAYESDDDDNIIHDNSRVAVRRPLLADRAASDPSRDHTEENGNGNGGDYWTRDNEADNYIGDEEGATGGGRPGTRSNQGLGVRNNGSTQNTESASNGPRLEPSGLASVPNEWNDV